MEEILHKKLYMRIVNEYGKTKSLKDNSLILSFLEIKSNERKRIIDESSISPDIADSSSVEKLKTRGIIREISTYDGIMFTLTAKGIFEYEKSQGICNNYDLIDYLDKKFIKFLVKKPNDKEKIILSTLLFTRRFNLENAMSLQTDNKSLDKWKLITLTIKDFLVDNGIIQPIDEKGLIGKSEKNEKLFSSFIRHTDQIPKKTSSIYTAVKPQNYFIDIITNQNQIHINKFNFIVKLIFDNFTLIDHENIIQFSEKLTWDNASLLRPANCLHFINTDMDGEIEYLYKKLFLGI